jgi:hypothetical protein
MIMNNKVFSLVLVGLFASMHIQSMNEEQQRAERLAEMEKRAEAEEQRMDEEFDRMVWGKYEAKRDLCFGAAERSWSIFLNFVRYASSKNVVVFVNDSKLPFEEHRNLELMHAELETELEHELGPDFLFIALDYELDYYVVKQLGITCAPAYVLSKNGRDYTRWYGVPPSKEVLKDDIIEWFHREVKCAE